MEGEMKEGDEEVKNGGEKRWRGEKGSGERREVENEGKREVKKEEGIGGK